MRWSSITEAVVHATFSHKPHKHQLVFLRQRLQTWPGCGRIPGLNLRNVQRWRQYAASAHPSIVFQVRSLEVTLQVSVTPNIIKENNTLSASIFNTTILCQLYLLWIICVTILRFHVLKILLHAVHSAVCDDTRSWLPPFTTRECTHKMEVLPNIVHCIIFLKLLNQWVAIEIWMLISMEYRRKKTKP